MEQDIEEVPLDFASTELERKLEFKPDEVFGVLNLAFSNGGMHKVSMDMLNRDPEEVIAISNSPVATCWFGPNREHKVEVPGKQTMLLTPDNTTMGFGLTKTVWSFIYPTDLIPSTWVKEASRVSSTFKTHFEKAENSSIFKPHSGGRDVQKTEFTTVVSGVRKTTKAYFVSIDSLDLLTGPFMRRTKKSSQVRNMKVSQIEDAELLDLLEKQYREDKKKPCTILNFELDMTYCMYMKNYVRNKAMPEEILKLLFKNLQDLPVVLGMTVFRGRAREFYFVETISDMLDTDDNFSRALANVSQDDYHNAMKEALKLACQKDPVRAEAKLGQLCYTAKRLDDPVVIPPHMFKLEGTRNLMREMITFSDPEDQALLTADFELQFFTGKYGLKGVKEGPWKLLYATRNTLIGISSVLFAVTKALDTEKYEYEGIIGLVLCKLANETMIITPLFETFRICILQRNQSTKVWFMTDLQNAKFNSNGELINADEIFAVRNLQICLDDILDFTIKDPLRDCADKFHNKIEKAQKLTKNLDGVERQINAILTKKIMLITENVHGLVTIERYRKAIPCMFERTDLKEVEWDKYPHITPGRDGVYFTNVTGYAGNVPLHYEENHKQKGKQGEIDIEIKWRVWDTPIVQFGDANMYLQTVGGDYLYGNGWDFSRCKGDYKMQHRDDSDWEEDGTKKGDKKKDGKKKDNKKKEHQVAKHDVPMNDEDGEDDSDDDYSVSASEDGDDEELDETFIVDTDDEEEDEDESGSDEEEELFEEAEDESSSEDEDARGPARKRAKKIINRALAQIADAAADLEEGEVQYDAEYVLTLLAPVLDTSELEAHLKDSK